jgi:hypothetical protein
MEKRRRFIVVEKQDVDGASPGVASDEPHIFRIT